MHILLQKMHLLLILSGLALLFLVHFGECVLYEQRKSGIPLNTNINEQHVTSSILIISFSAILFGVESDVRFREFILLLISVTGLLFQVNSQKTFDIVVHGILLWASMGFLIPVGILTMRMSSTRDCHQTSHKILFYLHAVFQVLSVLLVTVGAVLSIRNFENAFNNSHQRIGLALYAAIYVQIVIGFRRPKRGTRGRSAWYFLHWILGTTISLVGILNIYTGLQAYHKKTSRNSSLWTIIFTAQVSFMAIFYLFQDKWEYMQKQGIIVSGGALEISSPADQLENQKDVFNEPTRKSNALGTYFSRSNALNKLFQYT